jgi:ubiquitin C-terminal hydrolase
MAKKKGQTPQELYFARKRREEEERDALLPPGFVNHGNTCFMNSVLEGLIATQLLSTLVSGNPIHSLPQVVARRSPLLMNGHGVGAEGEEQGWIKGMPLGDVFVDLMQKAWEAQMNRRRISLSPRLILTEIGRKFDQYLDFAQQDAHEFLRQLLDAMRMEELDIIKQRNPPPPQTKRRRRATIVEDSNSQPAPDPSTLPSSFVDLIFSGELTSILVCQKCKKISQSHEAFDDLSLSIKPDDYSRSKKRDKLKTLAKKLKISALGVSSSSSSSNNNKLEHVETPRSSSVPPPRSMLDEEQKHEVEVTMDGDDRRKSWDIVSAKEEDGEEDKLAELSTSSSEKKSDGWGKLGRRISLSVGGLGSKRTSNSRERHSSRSRPPSAEHRVIPLAAPTPQRPSTSSSSQQSSAQPPEIWIQPAPLVDDPKPASISSRSKSTSPKPPPTPPPLSRSPRPPKPTRAEAEYLASILADITPSTSSNPFHLLNFKHQSHHHTSQSPLTTTNSHSSSQHSSISSVPPEATGNSWARMTQILGIEECLRMFTAVEVLDGENSVGCRRCWKIANGTYRARLRTVSRSSSKAPCTDQNDGSSSSSSDSDDDESEEEGGVGLPDGQSTSLGLPPRGERNKEGLSLNIAPHPHPLSNGVSISTPVLGTSHELSLQRELSDVASVSSLPFEKRDASSTANSSTSDLLLAPDEIIVPSISTTSPDQDSEDGSRTVRLPPGLGLDEANMDSLRTPRASHRKRGNLLNGVNGATTALDESSEGEESDASTASYASNRSRQSASFLSPSVSRATSPSLSHPQSPATLTEPLPSGSKPKPKPSRAERDKQVIPRPAYKRYLISKPPPVLVVHLKRFQQTSAFSFSSSGGGLKKGLGSPISAFSGMSSGFKKIEDHVAFGEWLDLAPFLTPRKEEFGLGRGKGKDKGARSVVGVVEANGVEVEEMAREKKSGKRKQRCMYRLYAVVVHLGNMLGGHYVVYTALPPSSSSALVTPASDSDATISQDEKDKAPEGVQSATIQEPAPRMWAYISDTTVRLSSLEEVLKAKAYLCFYERVYDC